MVRVRKSYESQSVVRIRCANDERRDAGDERYVWRNSREEWRNSREVRREKGGLGNRLCSRNARPQRPSLDARS